MSQTLKRVGILGLGQIGTSIALDLVPKAVKVYGVERNPQHRKIVEGMNILEEVYSQPRELPRDLDLLILAVPLRAIPEIFSQLSCWSTPITDTATLKVPVLDWAKNALSSPELFLGGHPLAGREIPGPRGGKEGLFQGKVWFLTPEGELPREEVERKVRELLELLDAQPVVLPPRLHDRLMTVIIGLPHLLAFGLGSLLMGMAQEIPEIVRYSGGSLRDQLRVTASTPEMVADILRPLRNELDTIGGFLFQCIKEILGTADDPQTLEETLLKIQRFIQEHYGGSLS